MAVTQLDLDDEALADVMRISGAKTKKEAVNLAMRELVERRRRIEESERRFWASREQSAPDDGEEA